MILKFSSIFSKWIIKNKMLLLRTQQMDDIKIIYKNFLNKKK